MNKILLEEINEVRSIMDLPILNEGTGFRLEAITKAVSVLDNLFGITTKTSDEIASKAFKSSDGSLIKIGKESAVILKKLGKIFFSTALVMLVPLRKFAPIWPKNLVYRCDTTALICLKLTK